MRDALRWFAVATLVVGSSSALAEEAAPRVVKQGANVGIEYTLKLEDGSVVGTSEGSEPMVYEQGSGQIPTALEKSLEGLKVGDETKVTLSPEQGYGPVRDELYQTVAIEQIPEGARKVGASLSARDAEGNERRLRVHEVREKEIVLDLNHPLAGETLLFEVKVVSVD